MCLDGLADQTLPAGDVEVLVVDNGSQDGSAEAAARHPLGPQVLSEPTRGAYAARNAGVALSNGPVIAFTDADCRPEPDWLAAGLAGLSALAADLAGGRIRTQASDRPTVWERYDRATYLRQEQAVAVEGYAATANLFVRRHVLHAVGPFDAALRSSGDLEFCLRANRAGFSLVYLPDAVVWHQPRRTLSATWTLHRRLGTGWAQLAKRGQRPPWYADPALRLPLGTVVDAVATDGPPLRRRRLAPVHAMVLAARLTGRLSRRG